MEASVLQRSDLYYRKGYKYQLEKRFQTPTTFRFPEKIQTDWVTIETNGDMTIERGYAWNGASGPTIDTPSTMAASLIHDALYQLISLGHLSLECREDADFTLRRIMIEDKAWRLRANYFFVAVDLAGQRAATAHSPLYHIPARCDFVYTLP